MHKKVESLVLNKLDNLRQLQNGSNHPETESNQGKIPNLTSPNISSPSNHATPSQTQNILKPNAPSGPPPARMVFQ